MCVYECMCVCVCDWACVEACAYWVCACGGVHGCTCVPMRVLQTCTCTCACLCMCVCVCVCECACDCLETRYMPGECVFVLTCVPRSIHVYTYAHTHTHTRTHTHASIHAHMHTCTHVMKHQSQVLPGGTPLQTECTPTVKLSLRSGVRFADAFFCKESSADRGTPSMSALRSMIIIQDVMHFRDGRAGVGGRGCVCLCCTYAAAVSHMAQIHVDKRCQHLLICA